MHLAADWPGGAYISHGVWFDVYHCCFLIYFMPVLQTKSRCSFLFLLYFFFPRSHILFSGSNCYYSEKNNNNKKQLNQYHFLSSITNEETDYNLLFLYLELWTFQKAFLNFILFFFTNSNSSLSFYSEYCLAAQGERIC